MQYSTAIDRTQIQTWGIARRLPALAVLALGLILLYGTGFVNLTAAHNTTHDARHAAGFPCH